MGVQTKANERKFFLLCRAEHCQSSSLRLQPAGEGLWNRSVSQSLRGCRIDPPDFLSVTLLSSPIHLRILPAVVKPKADQIIEVIDEGGTGCHIT